MPCLRSTLQATAVGFLANLSNFTGPDIWYNNRLPDAVHTTLPASLGRPIRANNTVIAEGLGARFPNMTQYTLTPVGDLPFIIDTENCIVAIHGYGLGITGIGTYGMEYIFTLATTENGTIRESWEFLDSSRARSFGRDPGTN